MENMLPWLDVNCVVGPRSRPRPENNLSPEQIHAALAAWGVGQALVRHSYALEYDPVIGNRLCTEFCRANTWALPCYAVVPHQTGDMPGGEALLDYLAEGGARAVTFHPAHGIDLRCAWTQETFAVLEQAGVPVIVHDEGVGLGDVDWLLTRHPRLHIISLRVNYAATRLIYPMLATHPTFHIEFSRFPVHFGLEEITARFGADRLIFGAGLPEWDPAVAVGMVTHADLSDADRAIIAGDGLRSLLWTPDRAEVKR